MSRASFAEQLKGKRVGMALSAGYFGFYHQAGVLSAVVELGIRPVSISGNSAGALVAAMYASGLDPQDIKQDLLHLDRKDFWDLHWPFTPRGFGFLAGHRFKSELGRALLRHSFETCRIPLFIGVYDLETGRVRHVSKGPLIPVVYASCALPYLFQPEEIDGRRYWDGGFQEKTPLVPFLNDERIDTVLVSYLPQRDSSKRAGLPFLPASVPLFADIPFYERIERDRVSIKRLKEAGKEVMVIAPKRLELGLFKMDRAREAFEKGRAGALEILSSCDRDRLGAKDLLA
jgi:NTE family protein